MRRSSDATPKPIPAGMALAAALALLLGACQGQLVTWDPAGSGGDPSPLGDPGTPGPTDDPADPRDPADPAEPPEPTGSALPSCFAEGFSGGTGSGEGVDVGGACEVTADCRDPLLCAEGACVAPGQEGAWCDGIDIACPYDGSTCVGGLCVFADGACAQNIDCPEGYRCEGGACVPAEGDCYTDGDCPDAAICDYGRCVPISECVVTEDLRGRLSARSVLHLAEAADGVVGAILDATEWIRNLLLGTGGVPGIGFLVDGIIRDWIEETLYDYQIDAIMALGDISDLLDDTRIDHTMQLDAPCRELYRGSLTFDRIEVEYRGTIISDRPEDIPRVGAIPPAEFGARLRCTSIAIDEFRVEHLVGGLVRWVTDAVVQQASEGYYAHVEDALLDVVDCFAIGQEVGGWMGTALEAACDTALDESVSQIQTALDEAAFDMGLMRIEGEAEVPDSDHLTDGNWAGSLLTGDFTGEFTASRI